nr:MAG TPA: hypothetical protein [Caudoviricetes sp.]
MCGNNEGFHFFGCISSLGVHLFYCPKLRLWR